MEKTNHLGFYSARTKLIPHKKTHLPYSNFMIQSKTRCLSAEMIINNEAQTKPQKETNSVKESYVETISELEKQLSIEKERYNTDMTNMQDYINLLRKKLYNNQKSPCIDEQVKREKEKALIFYKALRAKEKECLESHNFSSLSNWQTKINILILDKNRLEHSLSEAEKDMKRLYQEIKYQSEIINSYKEKNVEKINEDWKAQYEELLSQLESSKSINKELENQNKKLESIVKEQTIKAVFLTEKINIYEEMQYNPPKETNATHSRKISIEDYIQNQKSIEEAKIQCKNEIIKVAKEINDKFNVITLRTEQLENEEIRINHLLKLLQERFVASGLPKVKKIMKELEITKQELEDSIRENYDLHETLEEINSKSLETQEKLELEISKLKEIISQSCKVPKN